MDKKKRDSKKHDTSAEQPPTNPIVAETRGNNQDNNTGKQANSSSDEHQKSLHKSWRAASPINKLTVIFTGVIASATFLYCIFAGMQGCVMRGQLSVMGGQLEQMRIGYRPWVGLDTEQPALQTGHLMIDKDKTIHTVCSIVTRNFGNYPAQNVFAGAELMVTQNITSVHERERQLCAESPPGNAGTVVFPGTNKVAWQWPSQVTKEQMIRNPGGGSQFQAFVIGCIFYRDQFGELHHTGFTYRLQKPGTIFGAAFEPSPNTTVEGQWVEFHGFVD